MAGKDDKILPYDLENKSIPELEALLQQDFIASDGSSPNVDYIMAIMEVMHKKEQAQPDYQPLDTEKAWEEFRSFYILEKGRTNSIYYSGEENFFQTEPPKQTQRHKKSKTFRTPLLIAASLCLLVAITCVPVFGYHNIVQMLASWTAEQFGFYMPPKAQTNPEQIPEEFQELQKAMQELGYELIVPRFPEGFEAGKPTLDYFADEDTLKFSIMYQRDNDYYIFSVHWDNNNVVNRYEKSDTLVGTEVYNSTEHYYSENNGNNTVAWYINTIECSIVTNKTISDLREIIELMYNK